MDRVLFHLPDVVKLVGGQTYQVPFTEKLEITSVISDSRQASSGCLFVPLKGERTDGHYYIGEVFEKGGRASFVAETFWQSNKDFLQSYAIKYRGAYIIVPSPLEALHRLAEGYLEKKKTFRIGITGSNGKTTTKEIVGSILERNAPTFMNRGNLNSEIGLPLSVFEVSGEARWSVFEMGMNHPGEIALLVQIVKPEAGLITNIGTAHIGNLGSQKAIAEEKKNLLLSLPPHGVGFMYEEEEMGSFLKEGVKAKIKLFGERTTPGFQGAENLGLQGWKIHLDGKTIRFPLIGKFNLRNALGAVSLCKELGVREGDIREGLEAVRPLFGRGQILEGPITCILDCYNANPNSMMEALDFLQELEWRGRKVAVLGSMKELGGFESEAHRTVGEKILETRLGGVFLYGESMEVAYQILQGKGYPAPIFFAITLDAMANKLKQFLISGDLVLIKGSRSLELERLVKAISPSESGGEHV